MIVCPGRVMDCQAGARVDADDLRFSARPYDVGRKCVQPDRGWSRLDRRGLAGDSPAADADSAKREAGEPVAGIASPPWSSERKVTCACPSAQRRTAIRERVCQTFEVVGVSLASGAADENRGKW